MRLVSRLVPLAIAGLLAGCAGSDRTHVASWRGPPGRYYPPPGPPGDPWGPYIREATTRFSVPELWVREVMRQESGGQAAAVSSAGAIGLMQVMPSTYDGLRRRYGLGDDPFDPRDNMLAGTAYIREMYDRFGAPGFLAAYNAGPDRLDAYLAGGDPLPDETVNYLSVITPRIAAGATLTGPLAVYGMGTAAPVQRAAFTQQQQSAAAPGGCDADAAYDPSRSCAEPAPIVSHSALYVPKEAASVAGGWAIQVGAFADPQLARAVAQEARDAEPDTLHDASVVLPPTTPFGGSVLYRARLVGLSSRQATAACALLVQQQRACMTVPPDQGS